ncbi:MAG: HAD-IG family 5'-nucleotidase [Oligoflexales bacterium]|nr:HAD-IG family 5'-nucleotidase [Oligoflexales bacterium]
MNTLKLEKWQRVYVNRSLNMASIKSIGFDMDHTLVLYNRENFESLAFRKTLEKFIDAGYPDELIQLRFDPNFIIRGLLVDRERGNILKADAHKYVKIAYHGHRLLSKEERHRLYNAESFRAHNFLTVDTFFALSEVQLFTEIVDYMDRNPGKINKTFLEVYSDLRKFIDLSHNDGSIKNKVMANPEEYILKDKHIIEALKRLIEGGKKLFLLTNSDWDYTDYIMSYILCNRDEEYPRWNDFFEYIFVGTRKPGFFTESNPFHEVMMDSGLLKQGIDELKPHHAYFGGNAKLFQELTKQKGDEILYAGDHMLGDIIRSKELFNWRTLLIIEELKTELPRIESLKDNLEKVNSLINQRELADEQAQIIRTRIANTQKLIKKNNSSDKKRETNFLKNIEKMAEKLTTIENELKNLDAKVKELLKYRSGQFHPIWGELLRVGLENSRFAKQIEEYACLYTSLVSNLRFYSPSKKFASPRDIMPHDL